jgi:hypothetical protein
MKKTNGSKMQESAENKGLPQIGQVYFFKPDMSFVKISAHLESGDRKDIIFTYEEHGRREWSYTTDPSLFQAMRVLPPIEGGYGSEDLKRWADDVYGASPAQLN